MGEHGEGAHEGLEDRYFEALLDNAPWGAIVASTDMDGPCEYVNREFTAITGYTLDDLPRVRDWIERAYPDESYRAWVLGRWADDVDPSQMNRDVVYQVMRADGEPRDIQFRASSFGDTRMIVMLLDVTHRRRSEAERSAVEARLAKKQKLESLGTLAGGLAHDFNNLLVGLLGNADLVLMDLPPGSAAHDRVDAIKDTARRAADLSGQLLSYTGDGVFAAERIELRELVEQMTSLLESTIDKKARLALEFEAGSPPALGDERLLRQVVVALVSNASEALHDSGGTSTLRNGSLYCDRALLDELEAGIDAEPGFYSYLEVEDDGPGIDDETRASVFDPFFSTRGERRGLGLASVLGIARRHRGAIELDSAPGRGTRVRVLLPVLEGELSGDWEPADDVSDWIGRGTILLVDDERTVREVARAMLERAGFDVLGAQDGYEALEIFREHGDDFACVIVDLAMPRLNGEETYRELRKLREDVPVVLVSGYEEREARARFGDTGMAAFVQKPYPYTALIGAIRDALPFDASSSDRIKRR